MVDALLFVLAQLLFELMDGAIHGGRDVAGEDSEPPAPGLFEQLDALALPGEQLELRSAGGGLESTGFGAGDQLGAGLGRQLDPFPQTRPAIFGVAQPSAGAQSRWRKSRTSG